jgi:hypothetical protein
MSPTAKMPGVLDSNFSALPHVVEVSWPTAQVDFKLELASVTANQPAADPTQLWQMPAYPGYEPVDLADLIASFNQKLLNLATLGTTCPRIVRWPRGLEHTPARNTVCQMRNRQAIRFSRVVAVNRIEVTEDQKRRAFRPRGQQQGRLCCIRHPSRLRACWLNRFDTRGSPLR